MRVLITGASSGIGRDLAREFAGGGYDLVLVARDKARLEELKKELGSKVKVDVWAADLSKLENIYALYEKYKEIDILVNNAGFGLFGEVTETDLEKEIKMIEVNVVALHTLTKLYLKDMVKRDRGKILNVASIAGFMPGPLMSTYYATKNYVVSFSEGIREELRKEKSKVQISILCPGPVKTNFDEVAGVSFSLKGRSSEDVAKYTVRKFSRGKFYIVPGVEVKLLRVLMGFVPNSIVSRIVYYKQRRKR